jgi:two-component system, NarL family, invasion response regulator UvrY
LFDFHQSMDSYNVSTEKKSLTALIADRISLFSSGLQHMLMAEGGFERIDVADTKRELLQYISAFTYDVVIIDTSLENSDGVELLRQIRIRKLDQKVLFIGDWKNELFLQQCLMIGIQGYVYKNISLKELYRAIKSISAGNEFFTREISSRVIKIAAKPGLIQSLVNDKLTERELEVLKRVTKQYSNNEIANDLNISLSMVKKYKASLLVKTKSKNSVGLALFAVKTGLLNPSV